MADRRAFFCCSVAGAASLAVMGVMLLVYPVQVPSQDLAYLPPALALQFAREPIDVLRVFGIAGTPERSSIVADMHAGNVIDYVFMSVYGLFLSLFFHGQRRKTGVRAWWSLVPMIAVAIAFDVLENGVLGKITNQPEAPNMPTLLNELHLFSWGKWSTLAVVSAVAGMSFFARGAIVLGVLCLPPLLVILPAYQEPGRLAVFLVLGVGLSWAVMLSHAVKRAFFPAKRHPSLP